MTKKILILALVGLFTVAFTQVEAQLLQRKPRPAPIIMLPADPVPGDVGTVECALVQATVWENLGSEPLEPTMLYKNHGQFMKAVQQIVSPELEAGNITEECSSCITNQYARRLPVEEQERCGPPSPDPECAPATCETFIPCEENQTCDVPVCGSIVEGGGACVEGAASCASLLPCTTSADCPSGLCFKDSCCVISVCQPEANFCNPN